MPTHAALTCGLERDQSPVAGTRAKYIIVQRQGMALAILFHECISHSDAINRKDAEPISAGFYWMNSDGSVTTDKIGSDSLNLKPRPQDASIIADTLHLMGLSVPSVP